MSPSFALSKYTRMVCGYPVESMEQFRWPRTSRWYVCVPVNLALKVLFNLPSVWDYSLAPIPRHKMHCNGDGRRTFILAESMERSRCPWTIRTCVCIPVLDFKPVDRVETNVRPWVHASRLFSLSKYTLTAMLGVRLSWLNQRNGLAGPGRPVCTLVSLCTRLLSCCLGSILCDVITSPSFYITICYNGDNACALNWRNDFVDSGRAGGAFVLLCLTLFGRVGGGHSRTQSNSRSLVKTYCNGDGRCAARLLWFHRLTISLALDDQYVRVYSCAWLRSYYWGAMQCEVVFLH